MSDTLFIGGTSFKIADIESCDWYTRVALGNGETPGYIVVRTSDGSINRFHMPKEEATRIIDECSKLRREMLGKPKIDSGEPDHEELCEAVAADTKIAPETAAVSDKIRVGNTIIDRSYFNNVSRMTLNNLIISAISDVEGDVCFAFKTAEDASAAFDKLQSYLNVETF